MEEDEPNELGGFGFGIKILRYSDGHIEYQTQSANEGVPIEAVIMQMKAFLRNLEKDYFTTFDENLSKFKEE